MAKYDELSQEQIIALMPPFEADLNFTKQDVKRTTRNIRLRRYGLRTAISAATISLVALYISGEAGRLVNAEFTSSGSSENEISNLSEIASSHGFKPNSSVLVDQDLLFSQQLGKCVINVVQKTETTIQNASSNLVMSYVVNSDQSNFINVAVSNFNALKHTNLYAGCMLLS